MDLLCTQEEAEALGYHNPIEAAQQAAIAKERAQAHKQAINYQASGIMCFFTPQSRSRHGINL